jgi:hypothetical protein
MNKFETQLATLPAKELATVDVDLTKAGDTAVNLLEQAKRAVITDEETYAKGGDLIKIARVEGQKIEDLRKKLSGPYHKVWKFINDAFKGTGSQFDLIKKEIEPKMLAWKKAEDERLAEIARAEAKKLEDEALARAALETSEEGQDEVIEAAGEAAETLVEQSGQGLARGNFGSSTGTRKVYATTIINQLDFLRALVKHIDDGNARNVEIGSLIEFRKAGLNRFAQDMLEQGVKRMPGAEFTGTDKIRVY